MNLKRLVLCGLVGAFLAPAGSAAVADDVSISVLVGNLKSAEEAVRLQAIDQLAAEGPKAAQAVAPLGGLLNDGSATVRAHVALALGAIGEAAKPAVPALVELLKDSDVTVRRQAVRALVKIRPGPEVALPLYIKLLKDSDAGVQMRVLNAISEVGQPAVPGLIAALDNEKAAYWSCLILREMGPVAKAAVPALIGKTKDPSPEIRREAILALAAMDNDAVNAVGPIAEALNDPHTRLAAAYALGRIGKIPPEAEAILEADSKSDDAMLSQISLWALARVHPENKELRAEVTERLIVSLKDANPMVRVAAARALAALPPAPDITGPIWEKAMANADETTVIHALDALASLGPAAVPRLIEALKFEKARGGIVHLLGRIGPAASAATPALVKLIDDKNERLAKESILALAKIGPGAKEAVPALVDLLKQEGCVNTHAIVYALGKIGPDAASAQPVLVELLKNTDENLVLESAWALANIEPQSAEIAAKTLPILTAGLTNSSPLIRVGAAEALGNLGVLATEAIPALQKVMNDNDKAVRDAAAKAVHQIRGASSK